MENEIALAATREILQSDISNSRKAAKIVSQMFWHPGPSDQETWTAVIELVLSQAAQRDQGEYCDCSDPVINEKYNFCSRCRLVTRPGA
jgi:hypothetical protein